MKIKTQFIAFIVLIHAVAVGLSFYIFKENKLYFIASEVFILLSIALSWQLYQQLIQPISLLMTGIDAIKDRDFNVKFLKTGKYETDQLVEVYNQMIDQLRYERTQQQEQHYFLEKLVHTSPTGILLLDFDNRITSLNPKMLEMLRMKKEEVINKSVDEFRHPLFLAIARLKTGESKTISLEGIETYKCQKAHFVDRGFPHYFVMLEELTVEILSAQKNAYGKVIRMMAHEVNNSVGAVNSILDTTISLEQNQPDVTEALQIARDRNEHLNQFMRRFAEVVRLPMPQKEKINANELLSNVAQLMEYNAHQRAIDFVFELSTQAVWIQADRQQMEQVIINIVKNALESIDKKGVIAFRTSSFPAQLEVIDNGAGITSEAADQLFSPFFSTKKNGQGVGLTLVREILVNHGFGLSLRTEKTGETVFQMRF